MKYSLVKEVNDFLDCVLFETNSLDDLTREWDRLKDLALHDELEMNFNRLRVIDEEGRQIMP